MSDEKSFENFEKLMAELGSAFEKIAISFSELILPTGEAIEPLMRQINFYQKEDELFLEWSKRVQRERYLDDPEYRWQYQKATFRWIGSPLYWIYYKLIGDDNE